MTRSFFRAAGCTLALLLAAGCGDSGGGEAAAADTTPAFVAAADALSAKLGAGEPPAAADPAVKAFEEQTGKAMTALGTPALPVKGFDSFDSLCGKSAAVVGAYVNAGAASAPEAERAALLNRNLERYLDQIFTPLLFSAHCMAEHMAFIDKSVSIADVAGKRDALQQVRDGAYGQASGLMEMAGDDALDAPRRARIVDMLAGDAGKFATVLSRAQRQELAALADRVRATLPEEMRGKMDQAKAGFEKTECGKLCAM